MEQFKTIGLIGRLGSAKVIDTLERLIRFLGERQLDVIIDESLAAALSDHGLPLAEREALAERSDLVIVVGGDGSLLGAARTMCRTGTPVLGVNRGRLGFLTDISPDEVETRVGEVLDGNYESEQRFLLEAEVYRDGELVGTADALNDIVTHPGKVARMIEFELFIQNQFVYSQRSDGLIVATPTGSTAYALSGGGPILHPKLEAMVLVPMFPHTLSSRPLVIDAASEIRIHIGDANEADPHVSGDGQTQIVSKPGDVLIIRRKAQRLTLFHPLGHNYFETCRSKLGWSSRMGD
ncbi:NAD(+) kinase [Phytohalomonas tamaricis]|uniref:NAD(+) kinase n=1 Tax=Phytohalomonas tamaricis TaxID=2081032 RepID=UPI000D0BBBEC|nr:NAD(+) kinase [Phytohalomonas tamaricis]